MKNDNKSTLSYTQWGETVSVSRPNSDIKFEDFCEMVETLVRATWGDEYANKFINPEL